MSTRSAAVTKGEADFWAFSLAVYGDATVQQECLKLQDEHGIDINLVLFCAFAGAVHGVVLSNQATQEAVHAVGTWQRDIVATLRAARRALKPFAAENSPLNASAATLRARVKTVELEAEQIEQRTLERWAAGHMDAWPRAQPAEAIVDNLRKLFAMSVQRTEQPALPHRLIATALAVAGTGSSA
jgi:uncharacterized protein (TIGR02444 family)